MQYLFLTLAILTEVVGTVSLQLSQQFTRFVPSALVLIGYAASFCFMSLALKTIPIGIVYSIWSGVGIALIAAIGHFAFDQELDIAAILGISLTLVGIVIIQFFFQTSTH